MASAGPATVELRKHPSLLQRLLPSCTKFPGTWRRWRSKERCVDEPWPASLSRAKPMQPTLAEYRQASSGSWFPLRIADGHNATVEVLPITIVSISRQVPQSSRSQPASSKTGNQTTMSEVTQSAKDTHVSPNRSSAKQGGASVAPSRPAVRTVQAPASQHTDTEVHRDPLVCRPAICHPRPPRESKQVVEQIDPSFPYPSPFSPPSSQSDDISQRFEQRISEMARLQRETVLYERQKRQNRQLHRSSSRQSLTKGSSSSQGNASQSRGKPLDKRGSCTSLDAFSNSGLTQRHRLSSASSPQLSAQSRRYHSSSSGSSQTSSNRGGKPKRQRPSKRRQSIVQ